MTRYSSDYLLEYDSKWQSCAPDLRLDQPVREACSIKPAKRRYLTCNHFSKFSFAINCSTPFRSTAVYCFTYSHAASPRKESLLKEERSGSLKRAKDATAKSRSAEGPPARTPVQLALSLRGKGAGDTQPQTLLMGGTEWARSDGILHYRVFAIS